MTQATSEFEIGGEVLANRFGTAGRVQTMDDDEPVLMLAAAIAGAHGSSPRFLRIPRIPRLLLAAVLTSPIMFFDPEEEAGRSGVYSALSRREVRTRRRIPLRQARLLALRILAETEKSIKQDRVAEVRLLASIWDEEQA